MELKYKNLLSNIRQYFNLDTEIDDFDLIHKTILKDSVFKGTNLLVLIFAIFIASVGLNVNSTAVIIGAMLISPLMGPINGMGYSIATYDFDLFKLAFKNFSFAVIVSLLTSTVYFFLSPISTAHSELLARTSPTIYDVLIAFFGGLAGILAISSKQKGNVIPGVAIATALMPPLCTAGYGLATGQFRYFAEALYLFTINTVFIAISSIVMSQLLKFPIRNTTDKIRKKKINHILSTVIALILIPSIYFGYILVKKEQFIENANRYVNTISIFEGNYLLKNDINAGNNTITLVYGGAELNDEQKDRIRDIATDFSLSEVDIIFKQGLSLEKNQTEMEHLKAEINALHYQLISEKNKELENASGRNKEMGASIFEEIKTLYPQITSVVYAGTYLFRNENKEGSPIDLTLLTVDGENKLSVEDKERIYSFLSKRIKTDSLKIVYE